MVLFVFVGTSDAEMSVNTGKWGRPRDVVSYFCGAKVGPVGPSAFVARAIFSKTRANTQLWLTAIADQIGFCTKQNYVWNR